MMTHASRLHHHCLYIDVFESVRVDVRPALRHCSAYRCPFSVQTVPPSKGRYCADGACTYLSVQLAAVVLCALV